MFRIGLIGAGYGAEIYGKAMNFSNLIEPYSVYSRNVKRAKEAKNAYRFRNVTSSWQEITEDPEVDIVIVSSPNHTHYDIIKSALQHGKHCIVSAPFVCSLTEAEELTALALEKKVIAVLDFNLNYVPARRYANHLIKEGKIGEVQFVQRTVRNGSRYVMNPGALWKFRKESLGGIFAIQASHDIDYFLRVLGGIDKVRLQTEVLLKERTLENGESITSTAEDQYILDISFHTGTKARCVVNAAHPGREVNEFIFYGSKGILLINDDTELLFFDHNNERQRISIPPNYQINPITGPKACSTFFALLDSIIGAIYNQTPVSPTFDEAMHTQRVMLTALHNQDETQWRSLEIGGHQRVSPTSTSRSIGKIFT